VKQRFTGTEASSGEQRQFPVTTKLSERDQGRNSKNEEEKRILVADSRRKPIVPPILTQVSPFSFAWFDLLH
jgi:hypothetical protein